MRNFAATLVACIVSLITAKPANVILILTDDQSDAFSSTDLEHQPKLIKHIKSQGATIKNSFATTPVCCPSRSSIYTGKYIHNIGVHNNSAGSGNCASLDWQSGPERDNVAHHLSSLLSVKTSFSGKYLNNYGFGSNDGSVFQLPQCMNITNAREKAGMDNTCASTVEHVPRGWDNWQALVGNSCYYNYTLSNNGVKEKHGDDYGKDYLIDLVKNRSLSFIESQSSLSSPFFVTMSVPSAHEPADPAPQYASYGSGLKAPRTPNYNWVDEGSGRHWMVDQVNIEGKGFNETVESFVDLLYRRRLATLQSVDDLIEEVVDRLAELGELDNTYIIYTSDNGYHLGQFGVPIDKRQPYESDLRVPMFVRGPGIKKNVTIDNSYALNIDLAPTILDMSGLSQATISGLGFDGESLLPLLTTGSTGRSKSFLVEYNGENVDGCWAYLENDFALNHAFSLYDGINCGLRGPESFKTEPKWEGEDTFSTIQDSSNNTYKCVREIGGDYYGDDGGTGDFQYCEWESGEREAFDLKMDYWQMNNLVKDMTEEEIEEWHQKLVALRR